LLAAADASAARAEAYDELAALCTRSGCGPRLSRELVRLHEMALAHAPSTPLQFTNDVGAAKVYRKRTRETARADARVDAL